MRGEISPRLHARASLELYASALSRCENFLTLPHGGLRKRGGTKFVSEVIDSAREHRVIPFIFDDDQAYCILVGHLKLWVFAYGARVGTVEVVTPWSETEIAALQFFGSKDEMWITHPSYVTRKLVRNAHLTWALESFDPDDGPFGPVNTTEADEMFVSAATGIGTTITIESDFNVFAATDVGRLVRIDMESFRTIKPWEPNVELTRIPSVVLLGILRRYNGNVYVCATDETVPPNDEIALWRTGATPPTHTKGTEWDGNGVREIVGSHFEQAGVEWTFLHSGFGVARIATFVDAQEVTAVVKSQFPAELVGSANKSFVWRMGKIYPANGARSVTIFEERLALAVDTSVYLSATFNFDSFKPGPEENDGLQFLLIGDSTAWIADGDGTLAIGTIGGVRALSGSGLDEALTLTSFKNRKSRTLTCAPLRPVDTGASFVYVTKSRKSIAEMTVNQIGRFATDDLMQVSEHIPKKGVAELAYQQYPDPILWFPLDNGELGGFTYQPAQEVRGAHRHRLGGAFSGGSWGIVESACVTPGQSGIDDIWLVVKRTINGTTKRILEIITPAFENTTLTEAFQVDCGLSYSGAATATLSAAHLPSTTVDVLANGVVYRGLVTNGSGTATLPGAATTTRAHMGLPFAGYADSLELDVGGRDGSLRGRRKRMTALILTLLDTDLTGLSISSLREGVWEPVEIDTTDLTYNSTASLHSGNIRVPVQDRWIDGARFTIRHLNPSPCTILSATPEMDSE